MSKCQESMKSSEQTKQEMMEEMKAEYDQKIENLNFNILTLVS
jgi:regulator of PEP synthase PpsR (kinase-PPPase family)